MYVWSNGWKDFLTAVKEKADGIRHSLLGKHKKVAFGWIWSYAIKMQYGWADAFLTFEVPSVLRPIFFGRYWIFERNAIQKIILLIIFGKNP
jgi:hypothetical protein